MKKILFMMIIMASTCDIACAVNISNSLTGGTAGYYSGTLTLNVNMPDGYYTVLSGTYTKDNSESWVGSKSYLFGIGADSGFMSEEIDFLLYMGGADYSCSTLSFILTLDVNKIFGWGDKSIEDILFEILGEKPAATSFWDNFSTSLYFNLNLGSNYQVIPITVKISAKWRLGQTFLTLGMLETISTDTMIKFYYSIYKYSGDINRMDKFISYFPTLFNGLYGNLSSFPSDSLTASVAQYFFNLFYARFEYSYTRYVLLLPSNSYWITLGVMPFNWLEINGGYNLFIDPDNNKTDYYMIGSTVNF